MFQFVFSFIFPRFLEVDHPDRGLGVVVDEEEGAPDDLVCWEETGLSTETLNQFQSSQVLHLDKAC